MLSGALAKGFNRVRENPAKKESAIDLLGVSFKEARPELFHDSLRRPYIGLPARGRDGPLGAVYVGVSSTECRLFLQELYFRKTGKALNAQTLDQFVELLAAQARFGAPTHPVFVRVGGDRKLVCHDLCHDDGSVVEITAEGYRVTHQAKLKMQRTHGARPLPAATPGEAPFSGFEKFKKLLSLNDNQWPLALAFLLAAFLPGGPYPFLAAGGDHGSGKSTFCELLKRTIDPTVPLRSTLPEKIEDLMIMASHRHVLVFDNVSAIKGAMSDALATLATKAGFEKRQLYSDGDLFTVELSRPVILNGIGDFINRPDLMDRAIVVRLEPPPAGERKSESALSRDFDALLPELLHDLYTAIACAIRNLETTPQPTELRMADAAHWIAAAEPATGLPEGTLIGALVKAQTEAQADLATNESLFTALEDVLILQDFQGTAAELLEKLQDNRQRFDRHFPTTPLQLSNKLRRLRPALAKVGITVEFLERERSRRPIKICLEDRQPIPF